VYRATDTKLGRDVALKVLPAEMASSPERLERFRREVKALAALDTPASSPSTPGVPPASGTYLSVPHASARTQDAGGRKVRAAACVRSLVDVVAPPGEDERNQIDHARIIFDADNLLVFGHGIIPAMISIIRVWVFCADSELWGEFTTIRNERRASASFQGDCRM